MGTLLSYNYSFGVIVILDHKGAVVNKLAVVVYVTLDT